MKNKIDIVKQYFRLLETFTTEPSAFREVAHPELIQKEFPNLLNKSGQESNLQHLLKRAELGKKILEMQSYEITNHFESQNQMTVEAIWRGRVATEGIFKKGQELKAYFCIVLEFKDEKIYRQRNYDCFEL